MPPSLANKRFPPISYLILYCESASGLIKCTQTLALTSSKEDGLTWPKGRRDFVSGKIAFLAQFHPKSKSINYTQLQVTFHFQWSSNTSWDCRGSLLIGHKKTQCRYWFAKETALEEWRNCMFQSFRWTRRRLSKSVSVLLLLSATHWWNSTFSLANSTAWRWRWGQQQPVQKEEAEPKLGWFEDPIL